MEKLLDLTGKEPKDFSKLYRFQCDCLSPEDAMDIDITPWGKNEENKYITITMNFIGSGFWNRVKYAYQILLGNWCWREFATREEDFKDLSEIFDPNKKYKDLV